MSVRSDGIVTTVTGSFDVPVLPDIDFTFTIRDKLTLRAQGLDPPLETTTSTNLDTGTPGLLAVSTLVGLLSPILGVITFFAVPAIAASNAPGQQGVGGVLANQWPPEILTQIRPPFLPGKFLLFWSELTVDESGVRTLGTFVPAERIPEVSIIGPRSVSVREAVGNALAGYRVETRDLRAPLAILWGGVADGTGLATRVSFESAGRVHVTANVRDADSLAAADDITVGVSIIRLGPGQQPF